MSYRTMPMNLLPNGLTLLQQNPDCAARLDPSAKDIKERCDAFYGRHTEPTKEPS